VIATTRREALMGALAVPALAGLPRLSWARGESALVVYDPALESGRRLAEAHGGEALAIAGDRIRFARALFERQPALVVGVSRTADALLIEDVGREAGFRPVSDASGSVQELLAGSLSRDRGLVLTWLLAPAGGRPG
jgi:hypothetical protein